MKAENFCYWLQGLLEIGNPSILDENQLQIIKDHLQLVFKKETPIRLNDIRPYSGTTNHVATYPGGTSFRDWVNLSKEEYRNKYGYDPPASC